MNEADFPKSPKKVKVWVQAEAWQPDVKPSYGFMLHIEGASCVPLFYLFSEKVHKQFKLRDPEKEDEHG